MYKLMILIEQPEDPETFEDLWPQFIQWADQIPGLVRIISSVVEYPIQERYPCMRVHELLFNTLEEAEAGLNSVHGTKAGKTLNLMTQGKVTLLMALHLEDEALNVQHPARAKEPPPPQPLPTTAAPPNEDAA